MGSSNSKGKDLFWLVDLEWAVCTSGKFIYLPGFHSFACMLVQVLYYARGKKAPIVLGTVFILLLTLSPSFPRLIQLNVSVHSDFSLSIRLVGIVSLFRNFCTAKGGPPPKKKRQRD